MDGFLAPFSSSDYNISGYTVMFVPQTLLYIKIGLQTLHLWLVTGLKQLSAF